MISNQFKTPTNHNAYDQLNNARALNKVKGKLITMATISKVHNAGKSRALERLLSGKPTGNPTITRPPLPLEKPVVSLDHKFTFPAIRDKAGQEKHPELVIWRKHTPQGVTIQVRVPQPKGKSYQEQKDSGKWEDAGASELEHCNLFVKIDTKNPKKATYEPVYTSSGSGPHELTTKQATPHLKELKRLVDVHEKTIDAQIKPRDKEMIQNALKAIKTHLQHVL